jgi:hypothetical protein
MGKLKSNLGKPTVPAQDEKKQTRIKALARRVIQLLERRGYAPSLSMVRKVTQELFPNEDPEPILRVIVKWSYERTRAFFETLWSFLGVSSPPIDVEEALREGRGVSVWLSRGQRSREVHFAVKDKPPKCLSLHRQIPVPLRIDSQITRLRAVVDNVYVEARDGEANVFLRTKREEKRALEAVRYFRPLLEVLDLADLVEALEALVDLPPWEKGRVENAYFMAKSPYFSLLRRGLVLGDPTLDGPFFRGEPVVLSYPEGTELFLEATFFHESEESYAGLGKLEVKIKWQGETIRIYREISIERWDFLRDDPISFILWPKLRMASYYHLDCSPGMRLFLRRLSDKDDILKALGDREFHRKVLREFALEALASF